MFIQRRHAAAGMHNVVVSAPPLVALISLAARGAAPAYSDGSQSYQPDGPHADTRGLCRPDGREDSASGKAVWVMDNLQTAFLPPESERGLPSACLFLHGTGECAYLSPRGNRFATSAPGHRLSKSLTRHSYML
jgi:hypothetical protein